VVAASDIPDPLEVLVRRAAAGEEDAWASLVDRFSSLVWSVARAHRLDADSAADVSQTVWLRLVEHLDRLREPARVAGWLAATTRNECLRVSTRAARVVAGADQLDISVADVGSSEIEAAERRAALWSAVEALPARCHALVRLLLADPAPTYEEIVEALDIPIGSIGPTRARCLGRLREDLAKAGITADLGGSA
jgi:RNA polymerase sigma factor (sigma-70 family)